MSIIDEINNKTKTKINIKLLYWLIPLVLILWWYFVYYFSSSSSAETMMKESPYTVKKWDIRISLVSEWTVVADDIIDLNFQITDVISKIYKKPWDKVKKWDIIAQLDSLLSQINVDKA